MNFINLEQNRLNMGGSGAFYHAVKYTKVFFSLEHGVFGPDISKECQPSPQNKRLQYKQIYKYGKRIIRNNGTFIFLYCYTFA